ncbi:MAG: L-threonylcarbamoyladenylate synthase [Pseudomonadota bacterium]
MSDKPDHALIAQVGEKSLAEAADLLSRGKLVGVPTETVYGLAADATNGEAVAGIFEAKGRPSFNPLICHVTDYEMANRLGEFNDIAKRLAEAFWPGPLTLVLNKRADCPVHELATAGLATLAVRMPTGPMGELSARLKKPIAAPSANLSGQISATSALAVLEDLGEKVSLILDHGAPSVGVESTIVGFRGDDTVLLRPGGLSPEDIEKVTDRPLLNNIDDKVINAPGMLTSHYAPDMPVRLNVDRVLPGEALLAFGDVALNGAETAVKSINLSPTGNLIEAAQKLFAAMRNLNASGANGLAVVPIPNVGLGIAINDRLSRAAAPKDAGHG